MYKTSGCSCGNTSLHKVNFPDCFGPRNTTILLLSSALLNPSKAFRLMFMVTKKRENPQKPIRKNEVFDKIGN